MHRSLLTSNPDVIVPPATSFLSLLRLRPHLPPVCSACFLLSLSYSNCCFVTASLIYYHCSLPILTSLSPFSSRLAILYTPLSLWRSPLASNPVSPAHCLPFLTSPSSHRFVIDSISCSFYLSTHHRLVLRLRSSSPLLLGLLRLRPSSPTPNVMVSPASPFLGLLRLQPHSVHRFTDTP